MHTRACEGISLRMTNLAASASLLSSLAWSFNPHICMAKHRSASTQPHWISTRGIWMLVLTARLEMLIKHAWAHFFCLCGGLLSYTLPVYDTMRYYMPKFSTKVKQLFTVVVVFFFLFFCRDQATLCSKEWFNSLQMGFSKSFFAEFKERDHGCGTDAVTADLLADRIALSHTTCTVELWYSIFLVFSHIQKCTNTHKKS